MKNLILTCLITLTLVPCAFGQATMIEVDMPGEAVLIDPNGFSTDIPTAYGHIKNLTDDSLLVRYRREETLPSYWNTNICFGVNCYAAWVSTAEAYWAPGESKDLKVIFNTPPSPVGNASMRLVIITPKNGDSVVLNLSANALPWAPLECRKLSLFNDTDEDQMVDRVWVSDSVNFSITPRESLPFTLYGQSSSEYDLCVRAKDGKEYTTKVLYSIGEKVVETSVTLVAPSSSTVDREQVTLKLVAFNVLSVNDNLSVPSAIGSRVRWVAEFVDPRGSVQHSGHLDPTSGLCSVKGLTSGMYFVRLIAGDQIVGTEKILVK